MKTFWLVTVVVITANGLLAQQPPQIVIPKDYAKTRAMAINGKRVPENKVIDELSRLVLRQGHDAPIVAVFPESLTFADWNEVRGILWKVGFAQIRYFVRGSSKGKLMELQQVGDATDSIDGSTPTPAP
jgi:hypothetical protein